MEDILGQHSISNKAAGEYELVIGQNKILMLPNGISGSGLRYRRFDAAGLLVSELMIVSDESSIFLGIFPTLATMTSGLDIHKVYLKFKSPIVVDQKSAAIVYVAIPIDIAVYKQSKDEELMLDTFSLQRQQYSLYGSPESGVVCRYKEVEVYTSSADVKPKKYEEALVRIAIRNEIDNVVKISKVVIPADDIVLDHAHDDSWLSGSVEMNLDQTFGKDIINVRLVGTKVKRVDKTSAAQKTDSLIFLMDAGY